MADILTFKNLQDRVLAWLDEAGDTTTTLTLVKYAINKANKQRATQERWPFMLFEPVTFATVANQQSYALHSEYFRPLYFKNTTLDRFMGQVSESTLLSSGADWNSGATGSALRFALWGRTEVANQPSAASVLALSSSNAADNGAASLTILGITANGTLSEVIAANASSVNAFTQILKVTKSATWVGTATLTSNAGAVTNLVLLPTETGRSYQKFYLLLPPDVSENIEYRFYRQPFALSADNDRPDIPTPYEELLVFDALMQFSAYNAYDQGTVNIWREEQARLLLSLQQAYSDAEAVAAVGNFTTYIPR